VLASILHRRHTEVIRMLPPPPGSASKPLTPGERWGYGIFFVVLLGLFAAEVFTNYQPGKLGALLVVLFWPPLLVLHESGHAVVAVLLGWRVRRVVIGMGRVVARFRVGRTRVEIRLAPVEGFMVPVPTNLRAPQLKNALIYFAGPGVELLLLVVVVALVGPETLLTRTTDYGLIAVQSLAIAILIGVVINLVPHTAPSQNGMVANDGLGILRSFMLPDGYFAQRMVTEEEDDEAEDEEREPWRASR
jgi:hypothetical protein